MSKNTLKSSIAVAAAVFTIVACSSDDASTNKDAAGACKDLCSAAGFGSSNAQEFPQEINCTCSGGTGTVAAQACTDMCTGIGRSKGQPYKNNGGGTPPDSCQCS